MLIEPFLGGTVGGSTFGGFPKAIRFELSSTCDGGAAQGLTYAQLNREQGGEGTLWRVLLFYNKLRM